MISSEGEEAPSPPRRHLRWIVAGGAGFAVFVMIFSVLALILPETEKMKPPDLSALMKLIFVPEKLTQAPPPNSKREVERDMRPVDAPRKEPERTKRKSSQQSSSTARAVRSSGVARTAGSRVSSGRGLGNFSLAAGTGGSGAQIALSDLGESLGMAVETLELTRYQESRKRSREESMFARGEEFEQGAAGGQQGVGRGVAAMDIHTPRPQYTLDMRKRKVEGFVVLRLLISRTGTVEEHEILAAEPEGEFDEAVSKVLPQWSFSPAKDEDGHPIESWVEREIVFVMEGS